VVRVHHDEDIASYIDLEPCVRHREVVGEASVEERTGQPLSPESTIFPDADAIGNVEGNIGWCAIASATPDPAGSKNLACSDALCAGTGRSPV
jgi:hypothetical protein